MTAGEYGKAFEEGFSKTIRFLISRGAGHDIAEETAQAAWARGWACRGQLRTPTAVDAWVNSIAMNLFRNSCRYSNRKQALADLRAPVVPLLARLDAGSVLNRCRQMERSLIKLHYYCGYTSDEIGHRLGLSSTAVRVRLLRARRSLQRKMKAASFPPDISVMDGDHEADLSAA